MTHTPRLIFITGGVLSSLGKGIVAASLASLLEDQGLSVTLVKADPYLNIDSGTMSPFQHGEVFVTEDGAETDLDIGTYERFLGRSFSQSSHITSGKIFQAVLSRERKGDYLGSTVQMIPHVTDEIKRQILNQPQSYDVVIVEVGGTVGDIESQIFLEAVRQLLFEVPHSLSVHVSFVPYIAASGEIKTKPTQHSIRELRSVGLAPNLIVCRTTHALGESERSKLALFSNVEKDDIFESPDLPSVYEVPIALYEQGIVDRVLSKLGYTHLEIKSPIKWYDFTHHLKKQKESITIAIVGKYTSLSDAYKSIYESLLHAGLSQDLQVKIQAISAEDIERDYSHWSTVLEEMDGVLVPGGFGSRGLEGTLLAIKLCREKHIPFFGICLGMQLAVIEYCRNVLNKPLATSTEFDPETTEPVFKWIKEWVGHDQVTQQRTHVQTDKGGTMRLGGYPCYLVKESKTQRLYDRDMIIERHRHRYELNPDYIPELIAAGFIPSGLGPMDLVEVMELVDHPWFIGAQYHPEFLSSPSLPHPLFKGFIAAAHLKKFNKTSKL